MIPLGSLVFAVAAGLFALEHGALWEAFVALGITGLGAGFTSGASPGFIIRAVAQSETGSATGFYQVVRSIGLTVGSALAGAVLLANTRHGHALPDVNGFKVALIIAAALCLVTAVVSFVLPGRTPSSPAALTRNAEQDREVLMVDEAELATTGLVAGEEPPPSQREGGVR
jgi:MFS family permease